MLVLYTTAGCHLCEAAEQLLNQAAAEWQAVDIAEDAKLIDIYGIRIPVIVRPDGGELGWPFDMVTLQRFLAGPAAD